MGALPNLDMREAVWDKFRGAVVIPAGGDDHVVVAREALESWANRSLTPDEAVETAADEKALLARIANTLSAHDNVITITTGIINSRSWELAPGEEE